jgi:dihydroorotate dehydrogenase
MGFNNEGADALARRLDDATPGIPIGVNIGKSKITPIDDAPSDYAYSYKLLAPFADYVVVNVSSPNTPGLRGLQDRDPLTKILSSLKDIDADKPLFVKISPDLEEPGLDDIVSVVEELGLTGIVATNTTLSRSGLKSDLMQEGGLSGAPLTFRADEVIRLLRSKCGSDKVLIGVGGIMSAADAKQRLEAGADLIQVYTGWVYDGPGFVGKIVGALNRECS